RIVVHARASQLNQSWRERVNLVVDPPQHLPSPCAVAKLVDGSQSVVADSRREVRKVLDATPAVSQRAVNLQMERGVGRLHIVEVRVRQDAVPERRLRLYAQPPHYFQVDVEVVEHLTIDQGVIVVAEERLPNSVYQHPHVLVIAGRAHGGRSGAIGEKVYIG